MTRDELLDAIKHTLSKVKVAKLTAIAAVSSKQIDNLIDLSFYHDKTLAFRAAWILENAVHQYPDEFWKSVPRFLERFGEQENNSCRRHYTKIMIWIMGQEARIPKLTDVNWDPIIESAFKWLTEPACPVAVKANCLDILLALKNHDEWIAEELRAQIIFLMKDGSAGIQSRGKKILEQLD